MALQKLIQMLYTADLLATVDFYVNKLGFTRQAYDAELGWASLRFDQVEIMFSLPNDHLPFEKPHFTGSFYCYTDQVDALWQQLQGKAAVAYPIENFEYGMREFAVYDNNGYLLQFGQEI